MLEVKKLNYAHLKDISFTVKEQSIVTFLGANNSGKSLILKLIIGYLPSDNNISINKITLNKENGKTYLREIGVYFPLIENTVLETLSFPLLNLGYSPKEVKSYIYNLLTKYNLLSLYDKDMKNLNEINLVKIKILRAIVHKPKVLIVDDLYDDISYEKINHFLHLINQHDGITIIKTARSLEESSDSDQVFVLDKCSIKYKGTFKELLKKDNLLKKMGIKLDPILDTSIQLKYYEILDEITSNPKKLGHKLWR